MTTEVQTEAREINDVLAMIDAARSRGPTAEQREQEARSAASAAWFAEQCAEKEAEKEAANQAAAAIIYNIDTAPGTTDTIRRKLIYMGGRSPLARLQYRCETSEATVEDMMCLIGRGILFNTPIRLARYTDEEGAPWLALVDGHHRVKAFERLDIMDIPAHHFSIVDVDSLQEASLLAAGANVKHGKGNTHADYYEIIKSLMDHAYRGKYRKNAFEPDIKKIAEAIGAPKSAVSRGYNNYCGTEQDPHPSLSVQCKEMRDRAIINNHREGMNNSEIAKRWSISCPKTVADVIAKAVESGEIEPRRPVARAVVLPLANTEDRSDTRVDADAFVDDFLSEYDDYISLADDKDEAEPKPRFDLKAATGFGDDIAKYTKPAKKDKRQLLLDKRAGLVAELEALDKELAELEETSR